TAPDMKQDPVICIVGLGYVGLPLAHAFGKTEWRTIGYDIDVKRIEELKAGSDRTRELSQAALKETKITWSADPAVMSEATVIILAIPTPVDEKNEPDLSLVVAATETVGKHLKPGTTVVYESTVYPGVTEELCGPILEEESGLTQGKDFHLGYSPERINPGDRDHTIDKIVKVVAGDIPETTEMLAKIYGRIIPAGIHRAPSIKVAEMAKAIENAQRDLNIAYVNEIALMCGKLGIATRDVLAAARTKWNFLPFSPGLVGGHCIGVDPYYLITKARELGMDTTMMRSARELNDSMARSVAGQVLDTLKKRGSASNGAQILVLGLTFKEDIPDMRNSKVEDVVAALKSAGCDVTTHDPYHNHFAFEEKKGHWDAILLLVSHREYRSMKPEAFAVIGKPGCIFYDLKSVFLPKDFEKTGMTYLAL
ncbi:MAG: nucleotide sugar dehydrogenase, partial [Patescibacteria group bacterium]